jgi:hypothetical protein
MNTARSSEQLETVSRELSEQMAKALLAEGLYSKEARAMVHTWKDSWFEEDGLRVLYVLPRAWTDRTLPLTLNPAPRQLARVMVGRAEVLSPTLEKGLATQLTKAHEGDAEASAQVQAQFKRLGRFATPALQLALKGATPEVTQDAWNRYQASVQPTR